MRKSLLVCSATLLGVIGIVGTGATHISRPSLTTSSPIEQMAGQVGDDVQLALAHNAGSASLLEWNRSGFTPADVVANAFAMRKPEAIAALCAGLRSLPSRDLVLFEEVIRYPTPKHALPCGAGLVAALERHWQSVRAQVVPTIGAADPKSGLVVIRRVVSAGQPIALRPGEVALTFDGGPHPLITRRVLTALADKNASATFFSVGSRADAHPELVREILKAGHALGSETATYLELSALPVKDAEVEILRGRQLVSAAARARTALFRLPYGASSAPIDDYLRRQSLAQVAWTIDSEDWRLRDPAAIVDRVIERLATAGSGVIRFHDGYEQTAIALPRLLVELRDRHYAIVVFVSH